MEANPSKEPRAGKRLWAALFLFCLAGLGVAIELTVLHVRVHLDPAFRSFCAINETVNCDTVALSPYSVFLGVPVSVWGMLGYLAMAGVAGAALFFKPRREVVAGMMIGLTTFSVGASLVLGGISTFALKCFCLLCMITYGINLVLLVLAALEVRRWGLVASVKATFEFLLGQWKRAVPVGVFGFATVVALLAFYPAYWASPAAHGTADFATGLDEFGDPWIGAKAPRLTIIEYSDYQCPHCRRGHDEMRALLSKHPDAVRLVHRHYPLDEACNPKIKSPFHPYACLYAKMSICAGEQGRFWEANDYLFEHGKQESAIGLAAFAKALGADLGKLETCMKSSGAAARLDGNLQEGIRRGIQGTPSFQIGDRVHPGRIPPEVLEGFLGK